MTSRQKKLFLAVLLFALYSNSAHSTAFALPKGHSGVESSVVTDATHKAIFEAIQHSSILTHLGNDERAEVNQSICDGAKSVRLSCENQVAD